MSSAIDIRASGPGYAITVWRHLVIVAFDSTPTEEAAAQMESIAADTAAAFGDGIGMLHVVATTHGAPPGAAARAHYISMLRHLNDHLIAACVIATGEGFVSSIVRSVMAGFTIAARPRFAIKVFAEPRAASTWLSDKLSLDEAATRTAIEATREAIGTAV